MNSIYRVSVMVDDYQELELTGQPISVAADREGHSDRFDLWYAHIDEGWQAQRSRQKYAIRVFGTGHRVPWTQFTIDEYHHLGTVVTPSGLVWHVYTGPKRDAQ